LSTIHPTPYTLTSVGLQCLGEDQSIGRKASLFNRRLSTKSIQSTTATGVSFFFFITLKLRVE